MTQSEKEAWSQRNNIPLTQEYNGNVPLWRTSRMVNELQLSPEQEKEATQGATFFIQ